MFYRHLNPNNESTQNDLNINHYIKHQIKGRHLLSQSNSKEAYCQHYSNTKLRKKTNWNYSQKSNAFTFSKSTSSASCFPALWTPKICTRCFASGKPIYTRLSIRPWRTNSRSSSSGLLVAQIKMTACRSENLSTPVSSFLQTIKNL